MRAADRGRAWGAARGLQALKNAAGVGKRVEVCWVSGRLWQKGRAGMRDGAWALATEAWVVHGETAALALALALAPRSALHCAPPAAYGCMPCSQPGTASKMTVV